MAQKRNPPKHSVSWMAQLAAEKRKKTNQELEHYSIVCSRMIRAAQDFEQELLNRPALYPPSLEHVLAGTHKSMIDTGYTEDNFRAVQRRAIHLVYGDPLTMAQSNGYRHHAIPYWNPTPNRINVAPMGLVKSVDKKTRETTFWDFVEPGEHIQIPEPYTKGGKHSTVHGVAPQLKPLPRQLDNYLDLEPLTYTEWCTYMDGAPLSPCCRRQVVWYDAKGCLICSKCGKNSKGTTF